MSKMVLKLTLINKSSVRLCLDTSFEKPNQLNTIVNITCASSFRAYLRFRSAIKDLEHIYFSYASSVAMLLRVPVLARPQHSGSDC